MDTVARLQALGLDIPALRAKLKKPIRPRWITQDMDVGKVLAELEEDEEAWWTILCCTASHRVEGAEGSEEGYIQGAGDDSEGWSCGLTPDMFWEHKRELMEVSEGVVEELIRQLVREKKAELEMAGRGVMGRKEMQPVGGNGVVCVGTLDAIGKAHSDNGVVIALTQGVEGRALDSCIHLQLPNEKAARSRALREELHRLRGLLSISIGLRSAPPSQILCVCRSGKDLCVGVALMVLCLYFDEDGRFSLTQAVTTVLASCPIALRTTLN